MAPVIVVNCVNKKDADMKIVVTMGQITLIDLTILEPTKNEILECEPCPPCDDEELRRRLRGEE